MSPFRDFYRGRRVLVTGGLGFIGSNLPRALADYMAHADHYTAPDLGSTPA